LVADNDERAALVRSLGVLTHGDLLNANGARGVVYAEDFTDFDLLESFARALGDEEALRLLSVQLVKKRAKAPSPEGLGDVDPVKHWGMLKLIGSELPALELLDGDSKNKSDDSVTGTADKMQRLRWRYYEIESYLLHPAALARFLESALGTGAPGIQAAIEHLRNTLGDSFIASPYELSELQLTYLQSKAVSKELIPGLLQDAGLNQYPKSRFFEIAQVFKPEEVHPEVRYKLAQLKAAFGVGPLPPAYDEFVAHA
jgi:hypothetical protein